MLGDNNKTATLTVKRGEAAIIHPSYRDIRDIVIHKGPETFNIYESYSEGDLGEIVSLKTAEKLEHLQKVYLSNSDVKDIKIQYEQRYLKLSEKNYMGDFNDYPVYNFFGYYMFGCGKIMLSQKEMDIVINATKAYKTMRKAINPILDLLYDVNVQMDESHSMEDVYAFISQNSHKFAKKVTR